jgi:hypothetical protein
MRVAISLRAANEDWATASTYVVEAERLGLDCVWSQESWGHDAVTPLAFMAARTSRIRLGSGIMQAGTRTPALVAMTAMSLASMSGNRFMLGLGVSGPQVIEGWHGVRFERPIQRMREIVEIVRMACRGERLSYRGKVYELPLPLAPALHHDVMASCLPITERSSCSNRGSTAPSRHWPSVRAPAFRTWSGASSASGFAHDPPGDAGFSASRASGVIGRRPAAITIAGCMAPARGRDERAGLRRHEHVVRVRQRGRSGSSSREGPVGRAN